jgi:hypothetical protein
MSFQPEAPRVQVLFTHTAIDQPLGKANFLAWQKSAMLQTLIGQDNSSGLHGLSITDSSSLIHSILFEPNPKICAENWHCFLCQLEYVKTLVSQTS